MLAYLKFPVEASRGRRYPEPGHPYRNAFQRDRDRIVHTRAFRRLENKTQVFAPGISDHFRNRLTHTIEVSQIARTVASVLGLDEDLTEALALVHDVGHPPFAHAGEEALNRQMQRFGESFDHNIQALKIVETLEQRYPRFTGLNLSFEVREGIVKHSRDFAPGEVPEVDEYLPGLRPPLEAQLIDLADEVAYNAADLDDAHEAGLLTPEQIAAAVPAYAEALDTIETQFPGATERERFQESVRHLIDELVSGFITGTVEAANAAGIHDFEAVRSCPARLARFTPEMRETSLQLKHFLMRNVYCSEALEADRRDSIAKLDRMFGYLLEHPEKVPGGETSSELHRAVCNFIAGMTDRYFLRLYDLVFGSGCAT
ncbi:MAG: dNTP triphosphohydrolase [Acidobacteriota bacterium]|nr:dNTP triphosphohydrolase [Acidobacteriota bacterium]